MENRCFVVSVPNAKVKEDDREIKNSFPKAFKDSLYDYSAAYDDWCDAEGKYVSFFLIPKCACIVGICKILSLSILTIHSSIANRRTQ